jgi:hypothetical protein
MFDRPEVTVASLDRLSRLLRSAGEDRCILLTDEAVVMHGCLPPEEDPMWSSLDDEDLEELFHAVEHFVDTCEEVGLDEEFMADLFLDMTERLPVAG